MSMEEDKEERTKNERTMTIAKKKKKIINQ